MKKVIQRQKSPHWLLCEWEITLIVLRYWGLGDGSSQELTLCTRNNSIRQKETSKVKILHQLTYTQMTACTTVEIWISPWIASLSTSWYLYLTIATQMLTLGNARGSVQGFSCIFVCNFLCIYNYFKVIKCLKFFLD